MTGLHSAFALSPFNSSDKAQDVMCPAGELATGGGSNIVPTSGQPRPPVSIGLSMAVEQSQKPVGWSVEAFKVSPSNAPWTLVAYVICVPA